MKTLKRCEECGRIPLGQPSLAAMDSLGSICESAKVIQSSVAVMATMHQLSVAAHRAFGGASSDGLRVNALRGSARLRARFFEFFPTTVSLHAQNTENSNKNVVLFCHDVHHVDGGFLRILPFRPLSWMTGIPDLPPAVTL